MFQAEADEAQTTDSNSEEEQIVLLLALIPASLCNTGGRPIIFYNTFLRSHDINSASLTLHLEKLLKPLSIQNVI